MKQPVVMRPVVLGALVACLAVAVAPWLSGGQEPVGLLVSAGALLLGAMLAWAQPEVRALRRGPLVVVWGVLMVLAALSLLWTASRYSTVLWLAQWVLAGLAFRLAYTVAGEPQGRRWLLGAYVASAAVFCAVAIWIYLAGTYNRLTGTFWWANPAAAYLLPALVLGWDGLRRARGRMVWGWGALVALFFSSFLLADSRGAILVLGMMGMLYFLVMPTPKTFWITFVFSMAAGLVMCVGLIQLGEVTARGAGGRSGTLPGARFAEVAKGDSSSVHDRVAYVQSALDMWFAHPVGGTGAGTYGDVHPQYQKEVVSAGTSAHNAYAQMLAELGLAGAVTLAAVLWWLLAGMLRGVVARPEQVPVVIAVAGLLVHFGLDIDGRYPVLLMLVGLLAGVVYEQWRGARARVGWLWPAVAAVVLAPVVSLYQGDVWAQRGVAAQGDGDFPRAAADYAAARQGWVYNPDYISAEGINLYAEAVAGGGQAKEAAALALDRARQAERLDPHDGQHYQLEGRVLAWRGDLKGAEKAFGKALELDRYNHPDYALDLAAVQVRAGDAAAGVKTARAMLALYPDSVVANRNADATLRPELADLEALVGNVALERGDAAGARAAAERALKYDARSLRGRALKVQVDKAAP